MRQDWFRSRKTAGFSISSAGWRFGDGDVYEVIKMGGRRRAKRKRERLLRRKVTREEGVNGNGLKTKETETIQRRRRLFSEERPISRVTKAVPGSVVGRLSYCPSTLRDQLDRAFYEAIKIKACLVHS